MRYGYSVAETRRLEEVALGAVGEGALMQRAAHGLAIAAVRQLRASGRVTGARVVVLVGPGNNGGDALFAGARLATRGAAVLAVRALGEPHPAGAAALRAAGGRLVELAALDDSILLRADVVLDGVLGIGGRAGLPEHVARVAELLERRHRPVLAVDLPSGVETDTGAVPAAAFSATRTVTFGVLKACHLLEPASSRCGEVELVDIGLGADPGTAAISAWDEADAVAAWPVPGPTSDKYARGVVGVDTGSADYPGAAVLSTSGAVYGGAGMVRFSGADAAKPVLLSRLPNVVYGEGRVQAWLLGSGWGPRPDATDRVGQALDTGLPVVLDADALGALPQLLTEPLAADAADRVLLTPHAGELARLLGVERAEVTADPVAAVRRGAEQTGATVLLKGASQLVATPGGLSVDLAVPGPSWTGQAGSGDVLGGLCSAVLAAGCSARVAGVLGASLQAMAARRHPGSLPPQDLARRCAETIGQLTRPRVADA